MSLGLSPGPGATASAGVTRIRRRRKLPKKYSELFGPHHYYIELQRHPAIPECDAVNEKLVALARKLGLPIVATNDVHYVDAEDSEAQEILLCVQTQQTIKDKNRKMSMIGSPTSICGRLRK